MRFALILTGKHGIASARLRLIEFLGIILACGLALFIHSSGATEGAQQDQANASCDALLYVPTNGLPTADRNKTSKQDEEQEKHVAQLRAACADWETRYPLVAVRERNPWIGSDALTLALYPDGTLIFWKPDKNAPLRGSFHSVQLSPDEVSDFVSRVDVSGFQPSSKRLLPNVATLDTASFSVLVRRPGELPPRFAFGLGSLHTPPGPPRDSPELQEALRFLATYDNSGATEWIPEMVEVTLAPAPKASGPERPWPANLSGLEAATHNPTDDSYALQLSRAQYLELNPIRESGAQVPVFLIGGNKFHIDVRFFFPHELPPAPANSLAAQGRARYKAYRCWECHGDSGEGTDDGPSLIESRRTAEQIAKFLEKPSADADARGMPAIPATSPDLQALVAYVLSLRR